MTEDSRRRIIIGVLAAVGRIQWIIDTVSTDAAATFDPVDIDRAEERPWYLVVRRPFMFPKWRRQRIIEMSSALKADPPAAMAVGAARPSPCFEDVRASRLRRRLRMEI